MAKPRGAQRRVRVTLVVGSPGAAKASVIRCLVAERDSANTAVIVCPPVAPPADVEWRPARSPALLVLVSELRRLAAAGSARCLIAELPEAEALAPIIAAFGEDASGEDELGELGELEAVVAVIDGQRFFEDYTGVAGVAARGVQAARHRRHVAQLLAEQIEAADVLVVTQAGSTSSGELALLEDTLRHMNDSAGLCRLSGAVLSPPSSTGGARWGVQQRASGASGISSFVYRARRPFHPQRLREHLQGEWPGVLRSRGVFWLATRMSEIGSWSQAGPVWEIARAGYWWASLPSQTWAGSARLSAAIQEQWQEPFGDRRQELRFVGWEMDQHALRAGFERCLLTDEELELGPAAWALLPDPFAAWSEPMLRHPHGRARADLH